MFLFRKKPKEIQKPKLSLEGMVIEKLNLEELDILIKKQELKDNDFEHEYVKGYTYLNKDIATLPDRLQELEYNYSSILNQSFEKQEITKSHRFDYDFSIVARKEDKIIGIIALEWKKTELGDKKIWNYNNRFIETHEDYMAQGIATKLLTELEKTQDIQEKVVRFGTYSKEGKSYIKHKIPQIFCNNNYYILPKYSSIIKIVPEQKGCYTKFDGFNPILNNI
eukprot:GHVR01186243.1.p1 GENE.GHVR01186243.1~~GHVR01186243.1.p1  ORF type:complete len:223 (+),score=28.76 GHVR01186243.1:237-905(+)